jgi:hypothetical protein
VGNEDEQRHVGRLGETAQVERREDAQNDDRAPVDREAIVETCTIGAVPREL